MKRIVISTIGLAVVLGACGSDDTDTPGEGASQETTGIDTPDTGVPEFELDSDAVAPAGHQQIVFVNATGAALTVVASPTLPDDASASEVASVAPGETTGFVEVPYWAGSDASTLYVSREADTEPSGNIILGAGYGDETRNVVVAYEQSGAVQLQAGNPDGHDGVIQSDPATPSDQAAVAVLGYPADAPIYPNPIHPTVGEPGACPEPAEGLFLNGIQFYLLDPGPATLNLYPDDRTDACQGPAPATVEADLEAGRLYFVVVTGPGDYRDLSAFLVAVP